MLINPYADGEARPASDQQDVSQQKYETMQCFAVSEPKSIKEEGEGKASHFVALPLFFLFCRFHFFFSVFVSFLTLVSLSAPAVVISCLILSPSLLDFLSFSHLFFHPYSQSLVSCPPFITTPIYLSPLHRQGLISVWHFVIVPSYLITHIHTREKNLSGSLILDV